MPAWLIWTVTALISWAVWAVLPKFLGDALTAGQSQALSTLGILPVLIALACSRRIRLRGAPPWGIALTCLGGVVSGIGNLAYYDALAKGGKVASVVSLTAVYPLTTILLAVLILRERLNPLQLAGIALSFVAIWLFNVPGAIGDEAGSVVEDGSGLFSRTVIFALPPIILWGLSGFLQKVATNHLTPETASLLYLGAFVPVGIYFAVTSRWPGPLAPKAWILVLAVGFFLAFGNVALIMAFARGGKAAVLTPLTSLYPLLSIPAAVVLLHEKIGRQELVGIAFALASVIALSIEWPIRKRQPDPGT